MPRTSHPQPLDGTDDRVTPPWPICDSMAVFFLLYLPDFEELAFGQFFQLGHPSHASTVSDSIPTHLPSQVGGHRYQVGGHCY